MTAYLLFVHLFQLALPAAVLAALMVSLAGWFPGWRGRSPGLAGWTRRWLWTFVANLAVTLAGLAWFRQDGKMATYGALVLVSALAQFLMWRGWRR